MSFPAPKKKRRLMFRRKRTLDPNTIIDYKRPDVLKRFITERGKVIPRRISGASAQQQRDIATAVRRARYMALLPFAITHDRERGLLHELVSGGFQDRPERPQFSRPEFTGAGRGGDEVDGDGEE